MTNPSHNVRNAVLYPERSSLVWDLWVPRLFWPFAQGRNCTKRGLRCAYMDEPAASEVFFPPRSWLTLTCLTKLKMAWSTVKTPRRFPFHTCIWRSRQARTSFQSKSAACCIMLATSRRSSSLRILPDSLWLQHAVISRTLGHTACLHSQVCRPWSNRVRTPRQSFQHFKSSCRELSPKELWCCTRRISSYALLAISRLASLGCVDARSQDPEEYVAAVKIPVYLPSFSRWQNVRAWRHSVLPEPSLRTGRPRPSRGFSCVSPRGHGICQSQRGTGEIFAATFGLRGEPSHLTPLSKSTRSIQGPISTHSMGDLASSLVLESDRSKPPGYGDVGDFLCSNACCATKARGSRPGMLPKNTNGSHQVFSRWD